MHLIQIVFVLLLSIKLLSSIKTIVPIVVNSRNPNRGGMDVPYGRNEMIQNEQREECINKGWEPL